MTKEVPSQVMRASIKMSRLLSESLMNSPFPRLETLKAFDKIAVAEGINIADLNLPGREENLLTHLAFRKLDYPDEKQMLGVFEYVFEQSELQPSINDVKTTEYSPAFALGIVKVSVAAIE